MNYKYWNSFISYLNDVLYNIDKSIDQEKLTKQEREYLLELRAAFTSAILQLSDIFIHLKQLNNEIIGTNQDRINTIRKKDYRS